MPVKGRIVPEDIQELRQRADIVEVISGYMKLRKAGRVFKGLCCFHQEKTPSFTVDPAKGLYYCHGCGAGGDVFRFTEQMEGLSFSEAAQKLADRTGFTLRLEGPAEPAGQRLGMLVANRSAAEFFASTLKLSPEAEVARKYWESRGFNSLDAEHWKVGYAPRGRDVLYRHLLKEGLKSGPIVDAGLARVGDQGDHRDYFRGRVIFPVSSLTGEVVGFGARALGDDQPKYLNTSETPLYQKSRLLYGLDRAKVEIVRSGTAVVTEGYTDVIALHKSGLTNAVATCGTALGEEHFALLKRFCERVVLAFDADAAGSVASERGFGIHAKVGLEVLVAVMPSGKDPADVALAGGKGSFDPILAAALPLMHFVLEREARRHNLSTVEGRARAAQSLANLITWEPSGVARGGYGMWAAGRIGIAPHEMLREIADRTGGAGSNTRRRSLERRPGHVKVEREALAILLDSRAELARALQVVSVDHFTQPEHRVLFDALVRSAGGNGPAAWMDGLPDQDTKRLAAELSLAPSYSSNHEDVFLRLEEFRIRRRIDSLKAKLDGLDPEGDPKTNDATFEELMRLNIELRRFDDK
ncbi:MAG: DNA primase [Actinomycetota bacterium]